MVEVKISDNFPYREIQNFTEFYKSNKKFRKLIKNEVFNVSDLKGTNVKFKVTYVNNDTYLKVNIKICGYIINQWSYYDNVNKLTKGKHYGFRSARLQNEAIRNEINNAVTSYFTLLGMSSYYVKVGRINICDEL